MHKTTSVLVHSSVSDEARFVDAITDDPELLSLYEFISDTVYDAIGPKPVYVTCFCGYERQVGKPCGEPCV